MIRLALALLLAAASPAAAKPKAAVSFAPIVPATIETPRADDPTATTIHRLANGLTVYLSPDRRLPRVAIRVAVRAGSKNDPADSTGQAHYLEHMLFKGSQNFGTLDFAKEKPHLERIRALYEDLFDAKNETARQSIYKAIDEANVKAAALAVPNELDKFYRAIGAEGLNAYTSDEQTVYVVNIPSNRLDAWATVEAERFKNPVFRLFQSEIEAVYEEKNRSMDNAERIVHEELERRLFKSHPYGQQPTLGSIEHLKNPSLAKMYAFYERWYVPNNMAIVLSGDFDREQALEVIRRRFSSWTPRPLPALPEWSLPKPAGVERYEVKYEAEQKVMIAWPTVAASHPDSDALSVMDMIADNSAAGLFNLRLNQAQKVKASGSFPPMHNDAGAWIIWALPRANQTPEEAEALLLGVVDALKAGDFSQEEVDAVLTDFEINEKRRLESNDARADIMSASFVGLEHWERTAGRIKRLRAVTKADVIRVAKKYLGGDRIVVVRRDGKPEIPKIAKPSFTKILIDPSRESAFMRQALALPAPALEPRWLTAGKDYQITPIEGGRLYSTANPYNDLFQLTFAFERGYRHERRLCVAIQLLELSGAGPYSADDFKKKLYALGTQINYSCGEDESRVSITGLDRNFWPSLELAMQRFDWPSVPEGALKELVAIKIGAREDEKKDPGAVSQALGQAATRGRDSAVLKRLSNAELKALDEAALKSLMRGVMGYDRRVAYVGNRSPREIAKLLETGRRPRPAPAHIPLRLLRPLKTRVLFTHRDMVQAQIGLSLSDEPYDPDRYVDQRFYADYMGGDMSSVIFQEVRESRALAYSAHGGHTVTTRKEDDTQAWARIGCQADKTAEAVELTASLLRELPPSEKRFTETATAIAEDFRANPPRFRDIPGTVMDWEDQGLPPVDPRPKRLEKVLAYTLADLETYAARFKGKPATIWILGHRDRVGLDKLKGFGDFEEKPLDTLFPY